jgi:hypothetical protein
VIIEDEKTKDVCVNSDKQPLVAKRIGARYEVTFNNIAISLQPKLYKYLNKLYNADSPHGWLDKNFLDRGNNQVKYIYKLRKALEKIDSARVESDGAGRYRLVLESGKRFSEGVEVAG